MTSEFELSEQLTNFSGTAPVFPLPNVVLFPHSILPLHIFEDRYRKMVADALAGERLIAMALLTPGWEANYEDAPEFHEMVCLGRITAEERLPSGRYNLVLTGLQRAVAVQEQVTDLPYRTARLELYRDLYPLSTTTNRDVRRKELLLSFRRLFPGSHAEGMFARMFDADIPLGALCDMLANSLQVDFSVKQELLEEVDVDRRSELLLTRIREAVVENSLQDLAPTFPPKFSLN